MLLTFLGGRARGIEGPKISTAKSPPQFGPLDADVVTPVIVPLPLGVVHAHAVPFYCNIWPRLFCTPQIAVEQFRSI
jgi:hypothetical protein